MIYEYQNYRDFLKSALSPGSPGKETISLRSFAEKVKVSTSFLSEVMNSKKSLSVELAFKIGVKMNLTDTETQYLCLLVQLEQEKDPLFREELSQRLKSINPKRESHDLSADLFKSISEWYHAAILELTYLPNFSLTPESISKKIGISRHDANLALDRLKRLELLEKDEKGRYRKSHNYVYAESRIPDSAFKDFHGGLLTKANDSLSTQTPKERMSATDILAFDSKRLKEVDRLSQEFSSAVLKLAEKSKIKDQVYALSVHFFKVTKD